VVAVVQTPVASKMPRDPIKKGRDESDDPRDKRLTKVQKRFAESFLAVVKISPHVLE
jgi:hypothetical protein